MLLRRTRNLLMNSFKGSEYLYRLLKENKKILFLEMVVVLLTRNLSTELSVRYSKDRPAIAAISFLLILQLLSAIGNDFWL